MTLTPYELALKHGIIGCVSGGARDVGRDHSRFIKEKLRAKHPDVITLDERDFAAYRTAAGQSFRNLLA